jgi:hypothetical protein
LEQALGKLNGASIFDRSQCGENLWRLNGTDWLRAEYGENVGL